jgi:leucyl-tRNA synthetase
MNYQLKVVILVLFRTIGNCISPYAPHIAEELWSLLGNKGSIATVPFPVFEPKHLIER